MTVNYEGYFCVQTRPFACSCRGKPWTFIHYGRQIIVWYEKDDENILKAAIETRDCGLDPHIVEYHEIMGDAIDWDDIPAGVVLE